MKILVEKPWALKKTCNGHGNGGKGCGSVLEVEKSDLRVYSSDSHYSATTYAIVWRCCVCGASNDLKSSEHPQRTNDIRAHTSAWADGKERDDSGGWR